LRTLICYLYLLRNLEIKLKLKLIDFYFINLFSITIVVDERLKKTSQSSYITTTLLQI